MKKATAAVSVLVGLAVARGYRRDKRTMWVPPAGTERMEALSVRIVGDTPPRIVLLHGMFNSGRYWGGHYDRLAQFGGLVVPDLLGFGRSPRPPSGYTADAHADAVADTLRACGATGPMVVGAHSVGCLVAVALAARHPDLVSRIVGFAPPLYADGASARRHIASTNPAAKVFLANDRLSRALCDVRSRHPKTSAFLVRAGTPGLPAPLARDRVEHSWQSYTETLSNVVLSPQLSKSLVELMIPVRLVGGKRDSAVDLGFLAELTSRCPRLSFGIVGDAGHDLPLSHPEVCTSELEGAVREETCPAPVAPSRSSS